VKTTEECGTNTIHLDELPYQALNRPVMTFNVDEMVFPLRRSSRRSLPGMSLNEHADNSPKMRPNTCGALPPFLGVIPGRVYNFLVISDSKGMEG